MEFWAAFGRFLRVNKKFWLIPLIIATVLLALLVLLTENSTIAPFVYTLY